MEGGEEREREEKRCEEGENGVVEDYGSIDHCRVLPNRPIRD